MGRELYGPPESRAYRGFGLRQSSYMSLKSPLWPKATSPGPFDTFYFYEVAALIFNDPNAAPPLL